MVDILTSLLALRSFPCSRSRALSSVPFDVTRRQLALDAHDELGDDSSPPFHPDTSTEIQRLDQFLQDEECEGSEDLAVGWTQSSGEKDGLRGLFATCDFDVGEFLLALPFPATLMIEEKILDGSSANANEADEDESEIQQAIKFLENFVMEPHWKPYIDSLPRIDQSSFDATPDFWTTPALEEFPVPLLRQRSLERRQRIQKADFSSTDLQWAVWILRSRGFTSLKQTPAGNLRQRTMLLPLIDMINHDGIDPNTSIEVIETDSYDESFVALQALRPIARHEQITLRYGTGFETSLEVRRFVLYEAMIDGLSHMIQLLDKYGFFTLSNPNDARIDWNLVEHDRLQNLPDEISDPSLAVVHRFSKHLQELSQNRLV